MIPDGGAWAISQVSVGLLGGGGTFHHQPDNWIWERTRQTLGYALQGYRVTSRRVPDLGDLRGATWPT